MRFVVTHYLQIVHLITTKTNMISEEVKTQ